MKTDENTTHDARDRRGFLKTGLAIAGAATMESGVLARALAQTSTACARSGHRS